MSASQSVTKLKMNREISTQQSLDRLQVDNEKLHKNLNSTTSSKNKYTGQLYTIISATGLISSSLDIDEIKKRTLEAAILLVDSETASILFVDEQNGGLFFDTALGESGKAVKRIHIAKGEGLAGWVAESGKGVVVNDPENDARFSRIADIATNFVTRNIVALPVFAKGKLIGVLEVLNKHKGLFTEDDEMLLSALANQIGIAVDNAKLFSEIKRTFDGIVEMMAESIEKRDIYTGGHVQRVTRYSLIIGDRLGLSSYELKRLSLAATLHDIGKIGIRDSVLLKIEPLDSVEYLEICRHPVIGEALIRHIPSLSDIAPAVRGHHERYDGKGYPDGLLGKEIDILARIIAVADSFDALTSRRPYREQQTLEYAVNEIRDNAGKQFDEKIVSIFLQAVEEGQIAL